MPRFTTELRETGYITEANLKAKLVELFGQREFHISVSRIRQSYSAESGSSTFLRPNQNDGYTTHLES